MAAIRFTNAGFEDLMVEDSAQSWTLDRLNEINCTLFNDSIDNLIDLAQRLGCVATDEVLTTYISKKDRNIYMGLPRVHLNSEGKLCVFIGSKLSFPLTYEKKTKTYSTGALVFKVSPYKKEGESDIKAINFVANIIRETEGIEEELPVSLGLLVSSGANLTDITKALQNDTALPEKSITQLGVGNGGYAVTYKPWMLPVGFYKIMSSSRTEITTKDGKKALVANGQCSPVVDGVVATDTVYTVGLNSAPFNFDLITCSIEGASVYFYVDGGYSYDPHVATIGFALKLIETDGVLELAKWHRFTNMARKACILTRRQNSSKLFTSAQLADKKAVILGVDEPKKELAIVGTSAPAIDDIPF